MIATSAIPMRTFRGFDMVNSREQQKEDSRQRLLNKAGRRFRKEGYQATGLSQVTQDAGLTNGAFYAHFSSKEDLFQESLKVACEQFRGYWYTDLEQGEGDESNDDDLRWVQKLMEDYLSEEHLNRQEQGCIVPTLAAEVARGKQATRRVFEAEVGKNIAPLAEKLARLSDDSEHSAWGVFSLLVGGVILSRAVADKELKHDILEASHRVGSVYLDSFDHDK